MSFDPGFHIQATSVPLGFRYGADTFGSPVENRRLDDIRASLMDANADGPDILYAIAMDVGRQADRQRLIREGLLFGAVIYAAGSIGREPVRSQGHIHAISPSCGASTCEVYEIWEGIACVYMQETAADDPGRCFAVYAEPGEVVIVPPGWAHCTINADPTRTMAFGAWCVRDYGFDYTGVRAHHGLAWFPVLTGGRLSFQRNTLYQMSSCVETRPRKYREFGLEAGTPIYTQCVEAPGRFAFVPRPELAVDPGGISLWSHFIP